MLLKPNYSIPAKCFGFNETIHRFFDSSPFSPSNRYIAFTQLPFENDRSLTAKVLVYDTLKDNQIFQTSTTAWSSQVGAHVQWAETEDILFYNEMNEITNQRNFYRLYPLHGVAHNLRDGKKVTLPCPIYHISSNGKYGATSDLRKITNSQKGYGIDHLRHFTNKNASCADGLYVTNIDTQQCRLLYRLCDCIAAAGLDLSETPTFGFHVKWSSDDKLIMFIIRTLEEPTTHLFYKKYKKVRVQHLFVVKSDGSKIRHVISWASKPFHSKTKGDIHLIDGNHPNWIPNSYNISMNLDTGKERKRKKIRSWAIVSIHGNPEKENFDLTKPIKFHDNKQIELVDSNFVTVLYPLGTGHPTVHKQNRYIVTDAYHKEVPTLNYYFKNSENFLGLSNVPLRLIDTYTQSEAWIKMIPISDKSSKAFKSGNAWRCDPHAAWSRDNEWIAYNARSEENGKRGVCMINIGPVSQFSKYFNHDYLQKKIN